MSQLRTESSSQERNQKFLRRLKFYSTAAGLGAFACTSAAQGAIAYFDVPDVTITNNASGVSQFIDIDPDGAGPAPVGWSIIAPGAQNQIRISPHPLINPGDERGDHSDLVGTPIAAPSVPGAAEHNQTLSVFGNPGSVAPADPGKGYYVESVPAWFSISRATMSPSFYADLGSRTSGYPNAYYNKVGVGKYVGLQWDFDGTGDVRYGWAQIDVNPAPGAPEGFHSATLTAYAFEMTPNTPIHAGATPEPTSLALLAAGAGGLGLARRRRR